MSPPAKRVTIREVADAAGVSPAAVSYALRGIQVSEETQERVRKVADELGYEANPIARALASGRTGMVGILGPSLEDLWQQRLVAEAGRCLLDHDRYALILDAGGDPLRQRALATQLRDQQVDGLILSPVDPSDEFWSEIAESLAVVSIGDALPGRGAAGEVLFDNRSGVRCALEHLHALGHRRIAVLRPPGSPTNDRPAEVYVGSEADRLGLDVSVVSAPYELQEATGVARTVLTADPRPSAVFCLLGLDRLRRVRRRPRARAEDSGRAVGDRLRRPPGVDAARATVDQLLLGRRAPGRGRGGDGARGDRRATPPAPTGRDRARPARARVHGAPPPLAPPAPTLSNAATRRAR